MCSRDSRDESLHQVGDPVGGSRTDVVRPLRLATAEEQPVGPDDIAHVRDVAARLEVADPQDRRREPPLYLRNLTGERRRDVVGRLPRPGVIERPRDDRAEQGAAWNASISCASLLTPYGLVGPIGESSEIGPAEGR